MWKNNFFCVPAGPWVCRLPVQAAPNTWKSWPRLLPGVLHASLPAETGGFADAQRSHCHLRGKLSGLAHSIFYTTALGIHLVILHCTHKTVIEESARRLLCPAFRAAAQGSRMVPKHPCTFRAQNQRPSDSGWRAVYWIAEHRHHPGTAVPRGDVEHLQSQQLSSSSQSCMSSFLTLSFKLQNHSV